MKVKQQYSPVHIILETQEEMDLFWNIVEETWKDYLGGTKERELLIAISNALSCRFNTDG